MGIIKSLVVTFICSDEIHVYSGKTGFKPRQPYKIHCSVEDAKKYLEKEIGVKEPNILIK